MSAPRGVDGVVAAGTYAAEKAREMLIGTPTSTTSAWERPTTEKERAAMAKGIEQALKKQRLEAEARIRAEIEQVRLEQRLVEAESAVDVFAWM